jgi:ferredoxin-NADP reductase
LAGTALLGRLTWLIAEVTETVTETPHVRTLLLDVPGWMGHRAGQHVDIRLTAEDGYQAERSYSLASAPGDPPSVTVERLENGEVSPYLVDEVIEGDRFELRGPIGGYFVWEADGPADPLLLVAGGSGVVPLMAMLRHRAAVGSDVPALLLYSSRTFADIIYREELNQLAAASDGPSVVHTLTRQQPAGWTGPARRIDRDMLTEIGIAASAQPRVFVCGPTSLVEQTTQSLLALGHEANLIKTERFGPTGAPR